MNLGDKFRLRADGAAFFVVCEQSFLYLSLVLPGQTLLSDEQVGHLFRGAGTLDVSWHCFRD